MQNNIAWPKGYIPEKHEVIKPPPKKTSEEVWYEELAEKHRVKTRHLNKYYLDDEIMFLPMVAQT